MNSNVTGVVNDHSIIIILGLAVVIGLIYWIHITMKKNPDMTFGDIVNAKIVTERVSIFIITCFIINITEAIMAASITPIGETAPNPLSRIMSHMIIAIAGITSGLSVPDLFRATIAKDSKHRGYAFILFIFAFIGTFGFPYGNLILIAGGLKEYQLLNIYIYGLFPWNDMAAYYASVGLPVNFSPIEHMSYVLVTSTFMTFAHYFLVLFDGIHMIYHNKTVLNIKLENKGKDGKDDKSKDSTKPKDFDPITKLIKRYFNTGDSTSEVTNWITNAHRVHDNMDTGDKARLSSNIAAIVSEMEKLDRDIANLDKEEKSAKKLEFRNKIKSFFRESTKNGKGFGLTLPNVRELGN